MTDVTESLLKEFEGWDLLQALTGQKRDESLHVDFKTKAPPDNGELGRDDKEHLSVALSGFANAEGGLLIWGVDCRREDGLDVVQSVPGVKQIRKFKSLLESFTPEAVSPAVLGVEHRVVPPCENADEGVLITVVPQSETTPHMATARKLHRYYRRTSSSFRVMEHNEVADMFGRRPQPLMCVRPYPRVFKYEEGQNVPDVLTIQFMVHNEGRGVAHFPCVTIREPHDQWKSPSSTNRKQVGGPFIKVNAPDGWWLRYAGSADDVVYPGDAFNVAYASFLIPEDKSCPTFEIEHEVVATGCPVRRETYVLPFKDIMWMLANPEWKHEDDPEYDPSVHTRPLHRHPG